MLETRTWIRAVPAAALYLWAAAAAAGPGDTAREFLERLIDGQVLHALDLAADIDRATDVPLGYFRASAPSTPRFPSLWRVEILSVGEEGGDAHVDAILAHPEIERALRDAAAPMLDEIALQAYLEGALEMTHTDIRLTLVANEAGEWRVRTFAEDLAWERARFRRVEADIHAMNHEEIRRHEARLIEAFPHRAAEIAELVDPELAVLEVAEGLAVSDPVVIDDRTRDRPHFTQPSYDVGFTLTNRSSRTIETLEAVLVFRDAAGTIVETKPWSLRSTNLPAGLRPGESFSAAMGLRIDNLSGQAETVEIQLSAIRVR